MTLRDQSQPVAGRLTNRAQVRVGNLPWALLALLGSTLLLLCVAYALRPAASVAIGGRYDAPFVAGTHEREFGALFPLREFAWPTTSDTLAL
ncbi:MAG: hypothetical protein H7Z42_00200, partial [Roseiflexaceae bacterium]|nr:hypothetical protein [Roseiflexaceae bacterium]